MVLMLILVIILGLSSSFSSVAGSSHPQLWPAGMYGLPQTKDGCPKTANGFTWATGTIFQALNPFSTIPRNFHFQANATNNGVARSFCFKNTTKMDQSRPVWPTGSYCIYMKYDNCPAGLQKGSLYWNDRLSTSNYQIGEVPKGIYMVNTLINFCCSTKGNPSVAISLPNDAPFFLLTNYISIDECQNVKGTQNKLEYIGYDTVDANAKQYPPHPYKKGRNVMTVYYCYYTPCNWHITALSGTIQSPNYPSKYPKNLDCQWRIEVPNYYYITLIFDDFMLESSAFSCNLDCSCDWLKVTIKRQSNTFSEQYCMNILHSPPRIRNTYSSLVILDFHSDSRISDTGFQIRYTTTRISEELTTALPTSHLHKNDSTTNTNATPTRNTTTSNTTTTTANTTTAATTTATTTATTIATRTIASTTDIPTPKTLPLTETTTENNTVGSTVPKNESSTIKLFVTAETEQRQSQPAKTWIIPTAVALTVAGLLVTLGCLTYCRFRKATKLNRSLLSIRYSSDSSALRISRNSNTIDMYSGQDVEIIPESQLTDNPIYGSSVFLCSNDKEESKDEKEEETLEKSVNPLYATPHDLKTDNPLYESIFIQKKTNDPKPADPKPMKSENPLYERIM